MIVMQRMVAIWLLVGAYAVQAETTETLQRSEPGLLYIQDAGLVANIPARDARDVLQQARSFRSDLELDRNHCAEAVEETRFKSHDTLITIVMPGGLLYAMNKKQRHEEAKQAYAEVSQQLLDLKEDLARLQASTSQQAFALLN